MILAIDIGNTNIVIGGIDEKKTYFLERVTTHVHKTDLEYAVMLKSILEIHTLTSKEIEGVILSSVVPPLNPVMRNAVKKITGMNALMADHTLKTGMKLLTDHPDTVGADLIVDSVAAKNKYPLPIIVIDLGTATTLTVVDKNGDYTGGIIHPGLIVSLESLSNRTAQLPHIDLKQPGKIIAKNTIESMRSGILYGHASMIDGCIDRMEKELGCRASIVMTGGLAPFIAPLCLHRVIVDEDLMLKGLLLLYRENTQAE